VDGIVSIPFSVATVATTGHASEPPVSDFVVGEENRLIAAIAPAVAGHWGTLYNPLVIYGPPGVGKSHLATGLSELFLAADPGVRVVMLPAADFGRQFAESLETSHGDELERFRLADLLVVEDVQFLAHKPDAQDVLARILEDFVQRERQIILTLSNAPAAQPGLTPVLRSRLQGGLSVPVSLPGPEARLALLKRFAGQHGLELSAEQAAQLSADAATSRELLGSLKRLAHPQANSLGLEPVRSAATMADIAQAVATHFGVRLADLQCTSRRKNLATARSIAMYLARERTPASLNTIARYFGRSDHTTVMHACQKIRTQLTTDAYVRHCIDTILQQLP
jgi:chromosomal replication initiator protein